MKAFAGLTLGNECNQFTDATHPRRMPANAEQIGEWLDTLIGLVAKRCRRDGRLIAHSENDAIWYADGHAFLPRYASCKGDVTTVHSWYSTVPDSITVRCHAKAWDTRPGSLNYPRHSLLIRIARCGYRKSEHLAM